MGEKQKRPEAFARRRARDGQSQHNTTADASAWRLYDPGKQIPKTPEEIRVAHQSQRDELQRVRERSQQIRTLLTQAQLCVSQWGDPDTLPAHDWLESIMPAVTRGSLDVLGLTGVMLDCHGIADEEMTEARDAVAICGSLLTGMLSSDAVLRAYSRQQLRQLRELADEIARDLLQIADSRMER